MMQLKAANFLLEEGAAVIVDNSGNGSGGTLFVQGANVAQEIPATPQQIFTNRNRLQPYQKEAEAKMLPQMTMATEDYNRLVRMIQNGAKPKMTVDIQSQYHDEDLMGYNTIAEIPGTDPTLKDEIVMLGGHLDSWHAATGATDNAIGCAIMMEAARILKTLGVQPRRTIRVALWSGEEQGLLGSIAYVKEHFGSFEDPKPGYEKFGGYFNIDSGTGRVRGAGVFGPPEAATMMRGILEPFKEDGVVGAGSTRSRRLGGSDNTSFSQAGLPGIGMGQDPIEYGTHTWHTNLDTYERILEDDVKKDAMVVAWSVYQLAMRDDLLPRFSKADMPPKPAEETSAQPATTSERTEAQAAKPPAKKSRAHKSRRRGR